MANSYSERLSLISTIVNLMWKDGKLTNTESDFVDRLANLYQIEPIDLLKIKSGEFVPDLVIPSQEADRIPFFQTCVMAMGMDKQVTAEERNYCSILGIKMGIRQEVITRIMNLFEEHFPKPVPMDKLMEAYRIGKN